MYADVFTDKYLYINLYVRRIDIVDKNVNDCVYNYDEFDEIGMEYKVNFVFIRVFSLESH
jgi:hypothetical protein